MADRGQAEGAVKTPIDRGVVQRVISGALGLIGVKMPQLEAEAQEAKAKARGQAVQSLDPGKTWFGPGQPIAPVAPEDVKGRALDYEIATNLQTKPRAYEPVSFEQLRSLADGYDLLRLAIETRKDQMAKLKWSVMPRKAKSGVSRPSATPKCAEIEKFFRRPDGVRPWQTWLRLLMEDVFVIDAPSLYVRRRLDGDIFGFEVIDGATIKVVLAKDGRTPRAPMPAYQQVLKGLPAVEYTDQELIYRPRNPRPHKIYGMSPVEQIVMTVNIAVRRQIHQLQFYTEGNIPEALVGVPETWNVEQIKSFQTYWDGLLEGNTAARRHAKFVPGGTNFQFTKGSNEGLKDEFDEWIARVICYAFSLPPLPFVKQMNRATAETAKEAAIEEGLGPLMEWIKDLMDHIFETYFDAPDLEFIWDDIEEQEPDVAARINSQYLQVGVKSVDEIRAEMGLEPIGMGHAVWGVGPLGIMFVKDLVAPENRAAMIPPPPAPPGMPGMTDIGPDGMPIAPAMPPHDPAAQPMPTPKVDPLSSIPHHVLHAAGLADPGGPAGHPGALDPVAHAAIHGKLPDRYDRHPVVRAIMGKMAYAEKQALAKRAQPRTEIDYP